MSQKVEIDCGNGHKTVLTGRNLNVFVAVSKNEAVRGLEGEELVRAIVANVRKGDISEISRLKNGKLNDGPDEEFGAEEFNDCGVRTGTRHMKDGSLSNPPSGKPALCNYDSSGRLVTESDYSGGQLQHTRQYDTRGALLYEARFTDEGVETILDNRPYDPFRTRFRSAPPVMKAKAPAAPQVSARDIAINDLRERCPALKVL